MGPLISAGQGARVRGFVEAADEPVDIAFRGDAPSGPGFWYPPTVVLPRSAADRVWRGGGVGPGVAGVPFGGEADAVAQANDSDHRPSGTILAPRGGRGPRGGPRGGG